MPSSPNGNPVFEMRFSNASPSSNRGASSGSPEDRPPSDAPTARSFLGSGTGRATELSSAAPRRLHVHEWTTSAFVVAEARAARHEVELSGHDDLFAAERVAVQRLALQEPGDGLQADVGVWGDVQAAGRAHKRGPMWSTKHHGPTGRRPRLGSARRTPMAPTRLSRLWVISSTSSKASSTTWLCRSTPWPPRSCRFDGKGESRSALS